MHLWSISTTVRNPERLRDFLRILKLLENEPFIPLNQIKYQTLLIKNRLYKPSNIPNKLKEIIEDPEKEISYEAAESLFHHQKYKDPPMRGRQSVNPLNKLGFTIARDREGNIKITELGNLFLKGDYDIGYVFFKSLLKLQFPNPWSSDFSEELGFDVVPFIATMHLINSVNKLSNESGITQTEFSLFVPSLINYKLINDYANKILQYREEKNKEKFIIDFMKKFYKVRKLTNTQINNFYEYGDNIMRYFRLTRYLKVNIDRFGANWKIDLEPSRREEIKQILQQYNGEAIKFKNVDDYLNYISDLSLPKLPFENINNLKAVIDSLILHINNDLRQNPILLTDEEQSILNTNYANFNISELEQFIKKLRELNLIIKDKQNKNILINNLDKINDIIKNLRDYKLIKKFQPEQFEKLITEALKILNDEIKIKPNYPVDDNGEPISHASGNIPDIECYYKNYNSICEVTLNTSSYQWVLETQPVMRHLREFENKNMNVVNFCIFISPKIHQDTLYHFWTSIKHGYDGKNQNIIPLTTEQFADILDVLLISIQKHKRITHTEIFNLYNQIIDNANISNGHSAWYNKIPEILNSWKEKI